MKKSGEVGKDLLRRVDSSYPLDQFHKKYSEFGGKGGRKIDEKGEKRRN